MLWDSWLEEHAFIFHSFRHTATSQVAFKYEPSIYQSGFPYFIIEKIVRKFLLNSFLSF